MRDVRALTRESIVVTFDVPEPLRERFAYEPGQFLSFEVELDGERVRRSYSICSAPSERALRVAIKRVGDGRFSSWAHDHLVPGATIAVAPPDGRFTARFEPEQAKHYAAFASGSGITPILAIVRHILETEPRSTVTLVYGNRSSATTMFRDELQDLKDRYLARLGLLFVMSRESHDVDVLRGRIDREKCDALFASWIDPATIATAFVCGPESMTADVVASLEAHGVPKAAIKTELFGTAPRGERRRAASAATTAPGTVGAYAVLDGRRYEFEIERGKETVLDAGLRAGIELPYSCKGGVCSTCRAVLVEGDVEMDVHYALEDYEIERGFILTCQSYPVTDRIGIDVDAHSHV